MLSSVVRASAVGLVLLGAGAGSARATVLTDTVAFAFNTDGSQTVQLPQFDPALGTLTAASATVSAQVQPLLEIFNTGRSQIALRVQELLSLGTLQARTSFSFGGFIPDNTPVDGVLFPPMPVSTSTSLNGQLVQFTGPGALPFTLTLASPATLEQGTTVTGVISSASANGTITLDYTYTPSPVTAPTPVTAAEPASLALLGAGLVGLGLANRHHAARRRRAQMISFCRKLRSTVIALQAVAVLILRRELTTLATLWVSSQLGMSNPYVKRGKNDRNDADAICEAAGRSGMHFGPAKSVMHAAR